ncbi:hypothetical protein BDR26DRAFT_871429 [Obelidium mucronatum]|nr:hypothetical protein BDR26DRAFT_871429 [Obelidium mucronatum]
MDKFQQRIGLGIAGGLCGLLALRDVWQLATVLLGGTVTRYQLFLRWRLKTFHVEHATAAALFEPWALVLVAFLFSVAQSTRRRGALRYVVAAGAVAMLLRWVAKDVASIYDQSTTFNHLTDAGHTYSYAQHHAEAIVPVEFGNLILKRIEEARLVAEAENATDHDWLHAMRGVNYPVAFMMPDYYFAFPWSFIFLFLACLGASSLTHRYSVHWSSKGRLRFVKRYPDPEETEGNDTWDTLVDNPDLDPAALSLADQYNAKMEATRLLNNIQQDPEAAGISITMPDIPQSETPLAIFPIKDPNESQIEIGNQLRKRRDLHRRITRNVFLGITFIFLFLDLSQMATIASLKSRIASGKMKSPNMVLIVDLGVIPDDYNPPSLDEMQAIAATASAAVDPNTNLTKEKGAVDGNVTFTGTKHGNGAPHHYPMRPPPKTREWIPEYPLPMTTFLAIMFLVKMAVPPLFAPRVRLRLYKDKLVAIPLTYPVQYKTIQFADIIAIEIKGEETPSGTLYLRHRKYVKVDRIDRTRPFTSVRGYLYSGLGDLGRSSAEDHYLVMLRTKADVEEWGVQVQGMSVDRLRDMLDGAIVAYHAANRG